MAAWGAVLVLLNPFESGFLALLLFYLTLGLALVGTFSLFGYLFRAFIKKDEMAYKHISIASRQSILFTLIVIAALILQSIRALAWWNVILLLVLSGFVELYLIANKNSKPRNLIS